MNRRWMKVGVAASVAGAAVVLLDALFLEKYFFEVKTHQIGNVGSSKKLRLLLITDLHIKKVFWPYYEKLARKVNELQPDLILIAGDTLDGNTRREPVEKFFDTLRYDIPKVAILGNHDYYDELSVETLRVIYEQHNCELLVNQTKAFTLRGERFVVTGLDDFIESNSCVEEAVQGVGREEHHIMLIHSPLQQESVNPKLHDINRERKEENRLNIEYIFAGHNHGGQVRFWKLVPKLPIQAGNYVDGWYNQQSPYLYVSKGFGTSTVPFRFGARSELTLFDYYL